jgi:hypothetical protein
MNTNKDNPMARIKVKTHEFDAIAVKDSFSRRAMQFKNSIIASLARISVSVDDIYIDLEPNAIKKAPASITWYVDNIRLYYSHNSRSKYVENLYVVYKLIDMEITALIEGRRTTDEFIAEFAEHKDVEKDRIAARETLGLDPNVDDFKVIDKAYKDLAKENHPDLEGGDTEKFKEINLAHKILKRELM